MSGLPGYDLWLTTNPAEDEPDPRDEDLLPCYYCKELEQYQNLSPDGVCPNCQDDPDSEDD